MQNFNTKDIIWTSRTQILFLQVKLHFNVNSLIKFHIGICSFLFIVAHHTRYPAFKNVALLEVSSPKFRFLRKVIKHVRDYKLS